MLDAGVQQSTALRAGSSSSSSSSRSSRVGSCWCFYHDGSHACQGW